MTSAGVLRLTSIEVKSGWSSLILLRCLLEAAEAAIARVLGTFSCRMMSKLIAGTRKIVRKWTPRMLTERAGYSLAKAGIFVAMQR